MIKDILISVLIFLYVILCLVVIFSVCFQRGEDGVFKKMLANHKTVSHGSLVKITIISGILYLISSFTFYIILDKTKVNSSLNNKDLAFVSQATKDK